MTASLETSEPLDPRRVSLYAGHFDALWGLAWSPDGTRILSGSHDGTARIWDAQTGSELFALTSRGGSVNAAAWSPDGKRLATTSEEHTARIWDAETAENLLVLDLGGQTSGGAVAWSPDSTRLLTRFEDDAARIWDANSGEVKRTLTGHADNVTAVAWSPDRTRVATASDDGTARIWDVTTGTELLYVGPIPLPDAAEGEDGAVEPMTGLAWSPDSTRIITASDESMPRVWDAATGAHLLTLNGEYSVSAVAWSPDGTRIVTDDLADASAHVWDANSGDELMTLVGHETWACSLAWSPDSKRVATGAHDHTVRIWDPATSQCTAVLGPANSVDSVAWSASSDRIVVGAKIGQPRVWDVVTGEPVLEVEVAQRELSSFGWSPDGSRLAADSHYSQGVDVLNASTAKNVVTLSAGMDEVNAFAWSPEGRRLLTGVGGAMAAIWDADRGDVLLELEGHSDIVTSVAWSPNGARALTGSQDGTARIWDTTTGKVVRVFNHDWVREVAWTRGGPRVVSGSADGDGHVWDAITGGELLRLTGQGAMVRCFGWSPDGKHVVAGFDDGVARVWDEVSGEMVATLAGHRFGVTTVAWSPDGTRIATGSEDGTVRLWDATTGEMTDHFFCFLPDGEVAVLNVADLGLRTGPQDVWKFLASPEIVEGRLTRVLLTPRQAAPLPEPEPQEPEVSAAGAAEDAAEGAVEGAAEGAAEGGAADGEGEAEAGAGQREQAFSPDAGTVLLAGDAAAAARAHAAKPANPVEPFRALGQVPAERQADAGAVSAPGVVGGADVAAGPKPVAEVTLTPAILAAVAGESGAEAAHGEEIGGAADVPAVAQEPTAQADAEVLQDASGEALADSAAEETQVETEAEPEPEPAPEPWGSPELRRQIYTEVQEFISAIARRDLNELASRYAISGDSLAALEEQVERFPAPAQELSIYPADQADEFADGRHRLALSVQEDGGVLIESEVWREGAYTGGDLVAQWNPMGICPFDFRSFRF